MSTTKVKAIVIGGTNVKEKDRLLTVYSLEKGKLTLSMRGVRGEKAKLKAAKGLFTFGEFIFEEGKANIVTAVDIIDNFYDLTKDIDRYYEACAIVDVVNKVSLPEANPQLFLHLVKALKALCYLQPEKYNCIDKFLLAVLEGMGYGFLRDDCNSCKGILGAKYLNLEIGELVCAACRNSLCIKVPDAAFAAMKILNHTDFDNLTSVHFGGNGGAQAFEILSADYAYRTGYQILKF